MRLIITVFFVTKLCNSLNISSNQAKPQDLLGLSLMDLNPVEYQPHLLNESFIKSSGAVPNGVITPKIHGGIEQLPFTFFFQAGLRLKRKVGSAIWCGGAIISKRFILTAAHCLENIIKATVFMGTHNRLNASEITRQTQRVNRKNFIVHRSWNNKTGKNDIALIKLNKTIIFTDAVGPVIVADETYANIDDMPAIVSGWGYFNSSKELSPVLQYTEDIIINNTLCRQSYGNSVSPTNICLNGSGGRTACNGDGGGPLVILQSTGEFVLVGITSFKSKLGCDKFRPTVFTRISKYYKWIQKKTKS